ncbi:MAG: hypothetical protein ABFD76_06450 [Smithella sp.]
METRREKKNIIQKMPRSQLISRKSKMVAAKLQAILKKIKLK